jgi:hypothetical protein
MRIVVEDREAFFFREHVDGRLRIVFLEETYGRSGQQHVAYLPELADENAPGLE